MRELMLFAILLIPYIITYKRPWILRIRWPPSLTPSVALDGITKLGCRSPEKAETIVDAPESNAFIQMRYVICRFRVLYVGIGQTFMDDRKPRTLISIPEKFACPSEHDYEVWQLTVRCHPRCQTQRHQWPEIQRLASRRWLKLLHWMRLRSVALLTHASDSRLWSNCRPLRRTVMRENTMRFWSYLPPLKSLVASQLSFTELIALVCSKRAYLHSNCERINRLIHPQRGLVLTVGSLAGFTEVLIWAKESWYTHIHRWKNISACRRAGGWLNKDYYPLTYKDCVAPKTCHANRMSPYSIAIIILLYLLYSVL